MLFSRHTLPNAHARPPRKQINSGKKSFSYPARVHHASQPLGAPFGHHRTKRHPRRTPSVPHRWLYMFVCFIIAVQQSLSRITRRSSLIVMEHPSEYMVQDEFAACRVSHLWNGRRTSPRAPSRREAAKADRSSRCLPESRRKEEQQHHPSKKQSGSECTTDDAAYVGKETRNEMTPAELT